MAHKNGQESAPVDTATERPMLRRICWYVSAPLLVLVLYVVSIGPMTPLLRNSGDSGRATWEASYARPLGRLPHPFRGWVNRYISICERRYMELKMRR